MSLHDFERRVTALTQVRVLDVASPELFTRDAHHLFKVLRAEEGEEVVVTDGNGTWAIATISGRSLRRCTEVKVDPTPQALSIYMVPLKGDKSEKSVAKLVELGVTDVTPLLSQRLAVKFRGEAREKAMERWRRVAMEAAGQCRRTHDVRVHEPVAMADLPLEVAVAVPGTTGSLRNVRAVAIGPEGGWDPEELHAERPTFGLGETVLRAETAALAAATLLASQGPGWADTPFSDGIGNNGNN